MDIGAAEGLLSLDCVETACKVYIVEADPVWIPALTATFEPWKDKCIIVNKFVSDHNDNTNIRLDTLLCNESNHQLFIKMDIEGGETNVLNASKEWLTSLKNMKLACCTYHHHNDAKIMKIWYKTSNAAMNSLMDTCCLTNMTKYALPILGMV